MDTSNPKYELGISLSGGGARGIAHLGVLESLKNHHLEPGIISGASMGAIIGCLYAAGYEARFILEEIKKEKLSRFLSWSLPGDGFLDLEYMEELLAAHIDKNDFSALKKPLFVSVSNLNTGLSEIISKGPLFEYIIASASIPIVFKPRIINNQTYVDGGLLDNLPSTAIRNKCKRLIGVDVNQCEPTDHINGIKEIAERCLRLGVECNVKENLKACDFVIVPKGIQEYYTFDFRKADDIFKIGFDYTEKIIGQIIEMIENPNE